MFVTLLVSNNDKFIFFNRKHSLNIEDILDTWLVLKDDKLISSNEEHLLNIEDISVTLFVLNDNDKFIFF